MLFDNTKPKETDPWEISNIDSNNSADGNKFYYNYTNITSPCQAIKMQHLRSQEAKGLQLVLAPYKASDSHCGLGLKYILEVARRNDQHLEV